MRCALAERLSNKCNSSSLSGRQLHRRLHACTPGRQAGAHLREWDEAGTSCSHARRYRGQGVQRSTVNKLAGTLPISMTLNCPGMFSELSDFAVAAVLIYSGELTSSQMQQVEDHLSTTYGLPLQRGLTLPVTSGLVGWYGAGSFNSWLNQWRDMSGSNNHASTQGAASQFDSASSSNYLNNQGYLYGGTSARVQWPAAILPATYTLFNIARYSGSTRTRCAGQGRAAYSCRAAASCACIHARTCACTCGRGEQGVSLTDA